MIGDHYIIVSAYGGEEGLAIAVNEKVKEGYVPQGGLCVLAGDYTGHLLIQAMVMDVDKRLKILVERAQSKRAQKDGVCPDCGSSHYPGWSGCTKTLESPQSGNG